MRLLSSRTIVSNHRDVNVIINCLNNFFFFREMTDPQDRSTATSITTTHTTQARIIHSIIRKIQDREAILDYLDLSNLGLIV